MFRHALQRSPRLPFGRVSRHRWFAVLSALAFVLFSPFAHAVAPLCDPSAATMPAPVPAPPYTRGDLTAWKSCDDGAHDGFDAAPPGRQAPAPERAWSPPERVVPQGLGWGKPSAVIAPRPDAEPPVRRPGFSLPVYRPPRA